MNTQEDPEKRWLTVLRTWDQKKKSHVDNWGAIPIPILLFLKQLLEEKYGPSTRPIVSSIDSHISKTKEDTPFMTYLIQCGAGIEDKFVFYLNMLEDAFEMSFIERQRKEEDHLAYLLLGSTEVETEKYIEDLNYEVATVGKLYMEKYGTEQQDANFVGRQLGEALSSDDVVQKQFVIVIGIYMEKEYTYRFLPEHPDDEHPVLVNPRRFVHFVKDKLPEAIYQLCNGGNYCGLAEFMDDIRPSYIM